MMSVDSIKQKDCLDGIFWHKGQRKGRKLIKKDRKEPKAMLTFCLSSVLNDERH